MHTPVRPRGLAALAAVALVVAACMTSHDAIAGTWALSRVDTAAPAAEASLSLLPDGTFTMRPGCNTGGGTYVIDGNRLVTDALNLTMMTCDDAANEQERVFLDVLDSDPRFEIETGTGRLLLTGEDAILAFEAR